MKRRAVLAAVAAHAATAARAQTPGRVYRLGHLALTEQSGRTAREFILPGLAKHGFIAGHNLVFESRFGDAGDLPRLARELIAARPDAIVAIGTPTIRAVREATASVPIVIFTDNPVETGLAASLARPGGNVTGVVTLLVSLQGKRMELFAEALPAARHVGLLMNPRNVLLAASEEAIRAGATRAGIALTVVYAETLTDYPGAFAALRAAGVEALVIGADPRFSNDAAPLAALALAAGLPTSCDWAFMVRDGCLLSYGPDLGALRQRMAGQIARIFAGTAPSALPIEQPARFELVVNLRTANALGVTVPPALLARADEVIE